MQTQMGKKSEIVEFIDKIDNDFQSLNINSNIEKSLCGLVYKSRVDCYVNPHTFDNVIRFNVALFDSETKAQTLRCLCWYDFFNVTREAIMDYGFGCEMQVPETTNDLILCYLKSVRFMYLHEVPKEKVEVMIKLKCGNSIKAKLAQIFINCVYDEKLYSGFLNEVDECKYTCFDC